MRNLVNYEYVRQEFDDVGEDLLIDLTGITIAIFRDVHDGSIEIMIEVFGREGMDGVAITSETVCNPEDYLGGSFDPRAVYPADIVKLLDHRLVQLLTDKKLPIIFNRGWQTETIVSMDTLDQGPIVIEE